jgi:hypothetical protein
MDELFLNVLGQIIWGKYFESIYLSQSLHKTLIILTFIIT